VKEVGKGKKGDTQSKPSLSQDMPQPCDHLL